MESVLYSWLGAAALTPFVTILSLWTLFVLRGYKKEWRLVDLFLFALTSHEVVSSLFWFGFAVLSIIRPLLDPPCGFIMWGLIATRSFHLSAISSLMLDRALSAKWPYTYRLSVRQSQVRYHIVVLAVISIFVGVTSVFARMPILSHGICSIHPLAWDIKFSIFLSSVYGMLLLMGIICCLIVQIKGTGRNTCQISPRAPGWECSTSSSTNSSSTNQLRTEWSEHPDLEWRTVACVCWLSYILNHGPYLVMTVLGSIVPTFWSPWMDNAVIWLGLLQGIFIPFMLLVVDLPHRRALRNMLRPPGRIYRHLSDHGGFRLQVGDVSCKNGVVSPVVVVPSSNCFPVGPTFHIPSRLRWSPNSLPSLQSFHPDLRQSIKPFFCLASETDSITKHVKRCASPVSEKEYDTYNSLNSICYTLLDHKPPSAEVCPSLSSSHVSSQEQSDDGVSITTDAIDDFEFHGGSANKNTHPHLKSIFQQFASESGQEKEPESDEKVTKPVDSETGDSASDGENSKKSINFQNGSDFTSKECTPDKKELIHSELNVAQKLHFCHKNTARLCPVEPGFLPNVIRTRYGLGVPNFPNNSAHLNSYCNYKHRDESLNFDPSLIPTFINMQPANCLHFNGRHHPDIRSNSEAVKSSEHTEKCITKEILPSKCIVFSEYL